MRHFLKKSSIPFSMSQALLKSGRRMFFHFFTIFLISMAVMTQIETALAEGFEVSRVNPVDVLQTDELAHRCSLVVEKKFPTISVYDRALLCYQARSDLDIQCIDNLGLFYELFDGMAPLRACVRAENSKFYPAIFTYSRASMGNGRSLEPQTLMILVSLQTDEELECVSSRFARAQLKWQNLLRSIQDPIVRDRTRQNIRYLVRSEELRECLSAGF